MRIRSYLYVPADKADRLEKAPFRGADALIVDLEDGVSANDKSLARINLREWLKGQGANANIWVRVNRNEIEKDLEVAVHQNVKGIILPKSETRDDIDFVDSLLRKYEAITNTLRLEIIALIETSAGVLNAVSIASGPRVNRLILGEIDLRADLSLSSTSGDETIHFARNSLLYASAAAKIDPPIASVSTNFKDLERFRTSTLVYAGWGYFGRTCIHPDQVSIVNEVFSPSMAELEWAKEILGQIGKVSTGSTLDARGEMIDEAVVKIARRILGTN